VLSAGGMYGAYQAGAWQALAETFQPDLVVGASIGALNGWAVAGGCPPSELVDRWLNLEAAGRYRWQAPRSVFGGVLDNSPLQAAIRDIHSSYAPRVEFAMVATDLLRLRPRVFRDAEVTWRHLAASVAIVGIFDQVRIDGTLYSDGGLLSALPVWAAAALGAERIVAIDVLPEPPGLVAHTFVRAMKLLSPFRPHTPDSIEIIRIAPAALLGKPLEAIFWKRHNAEAWIESGRQDTLAALSRAPIAVKHSIPNCFERK
jgi:NTE family protein